MSSIPWAPGQIYRPHDDRITDLIMARGQAQASGHARSGDIWAGATQQLGQTIGGAVQQVAQAREMAKRDAAFVKAVESWDGKDPKPLLTDLVRILGLQEGPRAAQAVLAFQNAAKPEKDAKNLGAVLGFARKQSDDVLARWYPALRQRFGPTLEKLGIPTGGLPEQWSPDLRPQLDALADAFGGGKPQALMNVPPEGAVFDPETRQEVYRAAPRAEQPKKHKVTVPGPGGRPMARLATEEELATGVPEYREPKEPAAQRYSRASVTVDGREVMANYDAATGKYYDPDTGVLLKGVKAAPTADMRNKASARKLVQTSISAIESLSKKILTKVGPSQRAEAIKRGAEAVFGSDPEFRTYQDARMALAGNLAVAQQGSRPSDADIRAIWLPLVPDGYRDTAESARMKWELIKTMSLPEGQEQADKRDSLGIR